MTTEEAVHTLVRTMTEDVQKDRPGWLCFLLAPDQEAGTLRNRTCESFALW